MSADSLPTVLALDTATAVCAVALARGERVVELAETVGQRHSERLLPMVDALLREQRVTLADCAAIAFGAGPGSFTGLRVACAVAQGLGWATERPVAPVGNLAAIAWNARAVAPQAERVAVAIDARMNEAYYAVFDVRGAAPVELAAPALVAAADLAAALAPWAPDALAGEGVAVFASQLDALAAPLRLPQLRASAGTIARRAQQSVAEGRSVAPALAAPLYVRDQVALTIGQRAARRAAAG
ncbi:MAG: tRNA (adenosine(37)-N6)-threonylcarbamoyltransferase complex dimerization subunit type 1 TsaB [Burkholderiales bacterium]|nr:tRNA (adenosine(37)-N6)-threonylcarbamoyltransferase complex dimerization subunit type 1 TsaB [Burkholderiales bacterium]